MLHALAAKQFHQFTVSFDFWFRLCVFRLSVIHFKGTLEWLHRQTGGFQLDMDPAIEVFLQAQW